MDPSTIFIVAQITEEAATETPRRDGPTAEPGFTALGATDHNFPTRSILYTAGGKVKQKPAANVRRGGIGSA
jgi:hypothetical protein